MQISFSGNHRTTVETNRTMETSEKQDLQNLNKLLKTNPKSINHKGMADYMFDVPAENFVFQTGNKFSEVLVTNKAIAVETHEEKALKHFDSNTMNFWSIDASKSKKVSALVAAKIEEVYKFLLKAKVK